jgi:hypothetical protein
MFRPATNVRNLIAMLREVDPNTPVEQESGNYGDATAFIVSFSEEDEAKLFDADEDDADEDDADDD